MKIKAIKIDVQTTFPSIYLIEMENDLDGIYEAVGCDIFERVNISGKEDLLIDEEGLLKDYKWGFSFTSEFGAMPIMGNGVIVGFNEDGEYIDCSSSLMEICRNVKFFFI